jgi:hypothetical protein
MILYHYAECRYAECRYAECHYADVIMLSVVMLSVVMLSVVAPTNNCGQQVNDENKGAALINSCQHEIFRFTTDKMLQNFLAHSKQ